jgi:regulator of sirC expression with transglutaminase-like and TPR domain
MLRSFRTTAELLCEFCAEALLKVGKDVTEADYGAVYALYLYVRTKAQAVGGNAAVEYLVDELHHYIREVARHPDQARAVEEFFLSDEYRTDDYWIMYWQPLASYLCHVIQDDCVVREYGEERR